MNAILTATRIQKLQLKLAQLTPSNPDADVPDDALEVWEEMQLERAKIVLGDAPFAKMVDSKGVDKVFWWFLNSEHFLERCEADALGGNLAFG